MNAADRLYDQAARVLEAARGFHSAADEPGGHAAAPDSLDVVEEALQVLSGAWYQLAGVSSFQRATSHAASRAPAPAPDDTLSREQQVLLLGTMHDVAGALARAARVCRDSRSTVAPIIARRAASGRAGDDTPSAEALRFDRGDRPIESVA